MRKRNILLVTTFGQTVIVMLYTFSIFTFNSYHELRQSLFVINEIVIIFTILILVLLKNLSEIIRKEVEFKNLEEELSDTEALINLLRQQRHDHINHIQTISSMLILEEYSNAQEYLQGISLSYQYTDTILRLGNPVLTALINTKKELAEKFDINFTIESKCKVNLRRIKLWELSSIVSNLIDNAFDAVMELEPKDRMLSIVIDKVSDNKEYIIGISNTIAPDKGIHLDRIFEQGYSTKNMKGRGYGLHIVKELVEKYDGSIEVNLKNSEVEFFVRLED